MRSFNQCGMRFRWLSVIVCLLFITCPILSGAEPATGPTFRLGTVKYEPPRGDELVAERFRLAAHEFDFREEFLTGKDADPHLADLTFPSPVKTAVECNNTVHCEFFCPRRQEKVPAVIVLHILGGDFALSRLFCSALAEKGVAALFVKLPYYGPRRDPMSPNRMVSKVPEETVQGFTQAVLDIRRATAWLTTHEKIASERIGIFGISLGGITGSLAATAEPRLQHICLLLAGGDISKVAVESRELAEVRKAWQAKGQTLEQVGELLKTIDPVTYGKNVRGRRILMMNAKEDEVIPRACTESLWRSFGEPEIVWYEGTHYTVVRSILDAITRTTTFFENRIDAKAN